MEQRFQITEKKKIQKTKIILETLIKTLEHKLQILYTIHLLICIYFKKKKKAPAIALRHKLLF